MGHLCHGTETQISCCFCLLLRTVHCIWRSWYLSCLVHNKHVCYTVLICVFCAVLCVCFLYGPFCHGALNFDLSTLFTTFYLCKYLQFILMACVLLMPCPFTTFMAKRFSKQLLNNKKIRISNQHLDRRHVCYCDRWSIRANKKQETLLIWR